MKKRAATATAICAGMLAATSAFTAPTASAAPSWATGTPDITHTATNAEVGEAVDIIGKGVTACSLLGPVAVACQLSYDAHGPGEMETIYVRGCDLQARTWINPQSTGSYDRAYTDYAAVNC